MSPGGSDGREICLQCRRPRFDPWVGKIPWRRKWLPTPVFLPGKFHRQRNLVGYSPWAHKESNVTEHKKQNCQEKTQKAGPEFDQESRFSKQLTGNTEDKEHVTECYKDAICKIQAERFYKWPSFLYRSTTSINQLGTVNLNCVKTDANWKQTWSSLFKIRVDFSPPCVSEFLPLSFSHASNLFRLNRPHNLGMFPQGAGNHFLKCKHLGSQPPSSKGMDGGLLASICQKTTSHVKMWDVCFPSR